ncbi:death-inducer obliterator 1-like [Triplophysa rosa]|uniref:Death-inducer obliterator 1-like n=1 Tax=Triplophysa rosa TaxID=992332 RepID=A0A9W7X643_TRIRA|nr:death-inducer obliterator 1-like [Triplophysa rosa]
MEEDGKEDAPETEGAQVELFTEDLNDFQKEDGKEHTKKKDIVQDEEDLKAEEGNKEPEKPNEFGQDKVKNVDSKEVKTVVKEKDGEKDAQEVEGAKEEEVTQEITTFKKDDEKEHMSEKDLIQEEEDLTVDPAQEIKKGQQEEDVDVHCICRTSHNQEVMVQCSNCNNWYHPNCVSVPHKALDTTAEEWNCEICTN